MPSATSMPRCRLLQQVAARRRRVMRAAVRTVTRGAVAARLVEAHDQVAAAVVGALHRADLHAGVIDRDHRRRQLGRPPAGDDPQRQCSAPRPRAARRAGPDRAAAR